MTPERVDAIAQGRVWTGRQAKQIGLVDETRRPRPRGRRWPSNAPGSRPTEVEAGVYPPRRSGLRDPVVDQFGARSDDAARLTSLLGIAERAALGIATAPWTLFRAGEPLALMPFRAAEELQELQRTERATCSN